ncbi:unnamed protein product [Penicillium camemberti]|uniref:Str. FM013 n=1 Tax=Penicillium camemberti (strain FM 013) TaxID=1429867 RepID=A0A0G4P9G8_PENC3|nr:unnamed protein product [Penicillium camemberti]
MLGLEPIFEKDLGLAAVQRVPWCSELAERARGYGLATWDNKSWYLTGRPDYAVWYDERGNLPQV